METFNNSESLCRSCMDTITNREFNLFEAPQLSELFIQLSSTNLENDDSLPKAICPSCHQRLEDFHSFQKMCINSYKAFLLRCPVKIDFKQENPEDNVIKEEKLEITFIDEDELTERLEEFAAVTNGSETDNYDGSSYAYDPLKYEIENEKGESNEFFAKNTVDIKSSGDLFESDNEPLASLVGKKGVQMKNLKTKTISESQKSARKNATVKNDEDDDIQIEKKSGLPFSCDLCPKSFFKQERLDAHLRVHKGLKPYGCKLCYKQYKEKSRLTNHMLTDHSENPVRHVCTIQGCNKEYKTKECLKKHIEDHFKPSKKEDNSDGHGCICETCGKVFSTKSNLEKHTMIHRNEFPFSCDLCPVKCRLASLLRVHKKRHEGIKTYECHICGAKRTTGNELKSHINTHTREKTYPCQICSKEFLSATRLRKHVKVVHCGIKRYTCTYCNEKFGTSSILKFHVRRHTGEKPFECPICGRKFSRKRPCLDHVKRHEEDNKDKKQKPNLDGIEVLEARNKTIT